MKKGLKKILAATTALALLLSMGMTAMAAEYTTVTTYDANGVHVVTKVNAATAEKEYTYLVSKTGTVAQDSDIVFIDQKQATGTSVTFDFTTDVDNLNVASNVYSAVIQVGSNEASAPTAATAADGVINLVNKTVTYSAQNGYVYVEEDAAEALNAGSTSTFDATITFHLIPAPGYTTVGMTVNGDGIIGGANTYVAQSVTDGQGFAFVFAPITGTQDPVLTTPDTTAEDKVEGGVTFTPNKFNSLAKDTTRQLTYFGKVTGDAKEFGILVSEATFSYANGEFTATADVIKYAAAGKSNDGNFAISLFETKKGADFESILANETGLYVAVYAVDTDDVMHVATPASIPFE